MSIQHPDRLRLSRSLETWIDARKAPARRQRERARFEAALEAGRRSLDFLKQPLLSYQVEGALHLAFGERVLLADDMGLSRCPSPRSRDTTSAAGTPGMTGMLNAGSTMTIVDHPTGRPENGMKICVTRYSAGCRSSGGVLVRIPPA